jgi:UPF0755 protein
MLKYIKKYKFVLLGLALLGVFLHFYIGKALFESNVNVGKEGEYVEIPTGSSFEDVTRILQEKNILKSATTFSQVATLMKYNKDKVPAGRYRIKEGMNNRVLITKLRSGDQDPSKVVINNIRLISDLAGKASRYFEADSLAFLTYLTDSVTYRKYGMTKDNFMSLFVPNTYEMFWTLGPEKFVERMKSEYDKYWTPAKLEKIKQWNLDPTQAYIVASIVEKESNYDPERPRIAGVYLNRFMVGEKLQADPTVVFAIGDFTKQRVLYDDLLVDSPYNTYRNTGLPPGPICMPSLASLDAVVNAEKHKFMFFCAKADNSGVHAFAETFAEHQQNAAAFSRWLNSQGIR